MTQWISAKGIAKKYQITEKEVKELAVQKLITYSRISNTLIVDEESFISYTELIRQIEDKRAIVERLNQSDQLLETELQACNETAAAFVVEKQMLPLYPTVVHALSMLIPEGETRQIFHALALGERLDTVTQRYGKEKTETLLIYNNAIQMIGQDGKSVIAQWKKRCAHLETLNTQFANANIEQARKRQEIEDLVSQQNKELANIDMRLTKLAKKKESLLARMRYREVIIRQLKRELKSRKEQALLWQATPCDQPPQSTNELTEDWWHTAKGFVRRLFKKKA